VVAANPELEFIDIKTSKTREVIREGVRDEGGGEVKGAGGSEMKNQSR
jgi:hypothetical protein